MKNPLENYQVSDIIKESLRDEFNRRFNANLDYDNWQGINDFLDSCGRIINEKITEKLKQLTEPKI